MARPDWLVPGARVALVTCGRFGEADRVRFQTIDRVLERDAVLEDGTRVNADRLRIGGASAWDPGTDLLPADDPRVVAAVHENRISRRRRRALQSIEEATGALRERTEDGARNADRHLGVAVAAVRSLIETYEQGERVDG